MRRCLSATLLCLLPLAAARAQLAPRPHAPTSCTEALLPTPAHGEHIVSARQLTISPAAWEHYHRAAAAYAAHRADLGDAEAAKALALAPRFAEILLLRAVAALAAGQSTDTLTDLAAARALDPGLPWIGIGTAGALNNLHRYDDALTALATIPGQEATSWEAAYEHARAEVGLADPTAALLWSERALSLAPPGCTDSRLLHANALRLAGRPGEALSELETFLVEDRRGVPRPNVVAAIAKARASGVAVVSRTSPPAGADAHAPETGSGFLAMK